MNFRQVIRFVGSVALILSFGVFNIGLPVAFYLCPMMNDNPAECPMMGDQSSFGLSIVNVNPDCCGKVVLADRNTTPFVKAHSFEHEKVVSLATHTCTLDEIAPVLSSFKRTEAPQSNLPPVFLLNASLRI